MTKIRFEDLPSTNTPINAENLNKLNNVIVSSEEPTTGEEVWIQRGKNLIDENLLIFGMELDGNGGTLARSNYYITPFIEIESNTIYTFKGAKSLKGADNYYKDYYDKDYNFISSNEISTFTTPSNAKYVRFNGCSDFSIDLQLEKGEKITPKKIHTKTDNGYEEFYNEENREVYSTEEQRIGTWLGKPLYRKIISSTLASSINTIKTIATIENFDSIARFEGYFMPSGGNYFYPLPFSYNNEEITVHFKRTDGTINEAHNYTGANNLYCYAIVEYTKTTD